MGMTSPVAAQWRKVFYIYLAAVILRLIFVALFPGANYYDGISHEYINVATNIVHGHGLTYYVDIAPFHSGLTQFAYEPFISRPIGYVLFTALPFFLFGVQPVAVQVLQALVTSCSVFVVYALSRVVFERAATRESVAIGAAWLLALWPNQARFEIALLPDGLMTLVVLTLCLRLARYVRDRRGRDLFFAALLLGGSIYFRPDFVLLPVAWFVVTWFRSDFKLALRSTFVLAGVLAISVGANWWKNYAISGESLALNLGSGTTMFEGISQFGDTLGTTYADERLSHNYFNTKDLFYPNGLQNDRRVGSIAVDTILHHPWFYTTVIVRRIPLMFTVRGLFTMDTASRADPNKDLAKRGIASYVTKLGRHPWQLLVTVASAAIGWIALLFGAIGAWYALRRRDAELFVPALIVGYFLATHLVTNVEPRYFYPLVPLFFPFAVYGARMFLTRRRRQVKIV